MTSSEVLFKLKGILPKSEIMHAWIQIFLPQLCNDFKVSHTACCVGLPSSQGLCQLCMYMEMNLQTSLTPLVVKSVTCLPITLAYHALVSFREIHSDLDDHYNGGPMLLGSIPSGKRTLRDVDNRSSSSRVLSNRSSFSGIISDNNLISCSMFRLICIDEFKYRSIFGKVFVK